MVLSLCDMLSTTLFELFTMYTYWKNKLIKQRGKNPFNEKKKVEEEKMKFGIK